MNATAADFKRIDKTIQEKISECQGIIEELHSKISPRTDVYWQSSQEYDDNNYYNSFSLRSIEGVAIDDFPAKDELLKAVKELKNAIAKGEEDAHELLSVGSFLDDIEYGHDLAELVEDIARGKSNIDALYEIISLGEYGILESQCPLELISRD